MRNNFQLNSSDEVDMFSDVTSISASYVISVQVGRQLHGSNSAATMSDCISSMHASSFGNPQVSIPLISLKKQN
jgi:hypothetical protein